MTWKKTGVVPEALPLGTMREVTMGASSILLSHVASGFRATDAVCPHLGGLLADGTLVGTRVTCPEHGAVYDVGSGKVLVDPFGIEPPEGGVDPLRTYPTRVESGMLEVDLP